jgi:hypothetical protein
MEEGSVAGVSFERLRAPKEEKVDVVEVSSVIC